MDGSDHWDDKLTEEGRENANVGSGSAGTKWDESPVAVTLSNFVWLYLARSIWRITFVIIKQLDGCGTIHHVDPLSARALPRNWSPSGGC